MSIVPNHASYSILQLQKQNNQFLLFLIQHMHPNLIYPALMNKYPNQKIDSQLDYRLFLSLIFLMTRGRLCLVLVARAIRSLFNGLFCCSLVPYSFYTNFKGPPYMLALTIFACAITAIYKSNLINKHKNDPLRALYIAYLFFLPTLFISHYNLTGAWPIVALKIILMLGLYPTDGEDFAFFQEAERGLIPQDVPHNRKQKIISAQNLIGSLFQALGSLAALLYLTYDLQSIEYFHRARQNEIFILLYLLAIINMVLFTAVQVIHAKKMQADPPAEHQPPTNNPPIDKKMKAAHFINGLAVGALSAPILAYSLQLKFNLHTDTIAVVMFAFFLLKGVGEEAMRRLPSLRWLFECWNLLSALSLSWVYFSTDADIRISCIFFALPMWHFGRAALRQRVQSCDGRETDGRSGENEAEAIITEGRNWQRGGNVVGILLSGFTFMILYYKSYFSYAFLLSAFFKILSQVFIKYFLCRSGSKRIGQVLELTDPVREVLDDASKDMSDADGAITTRELYSLSKDTLDAGAAIPPRQPYCVLFNIKKIWPILILACLIPVYTYYSYSTHLPNLNAHFKTRSEKNDAPLQLKLFNSSLAHLWAKEGVKGVQLINCDQDCTHKITKRDDFYAQMQYGSPTPQWLHFPNTPYFSSVLQLRDEIKVLEQYPSAKGFSFTWNDPVRYNKMPYEIYSLLKEAGKDYGFFYAQMPSLNLRALQYRVIMVFTRQLRKAVTLPSFVGRQPPKNYLAFQTTFKLATNHQYLRQFILYHMRLGFDKFFLYNNDREPSDPTFYWQHRDTGAYYQQCFNFGIQQVYQNMHDIWQEFYDHIIYVPMLVERRKNQVQAYINYGLFFRHDVVYTSFTDLDELLYSPSGLYLPDILQKMAQEDNVSGLLISARNFISRICRKQKLVLDESRWMVIPPGAVTIKNIVMTRLVYDALIHYKPTINGIFVDQTTSPHPREDFTLLHYKVTSTYEEFNGKNTFMIDDSLQGLVPAMKEACGGKCSDSRKITCAPEVYQQQMARYCIKE